MPGRPEGRSGRSGAKGGGLPSLDAPCTQRQAAEAYRPGGRRSRRPGGEPARSSAARTAAAGAVGNSLGSCAASAKPRTRASGRSASRRTVAPAASTTAAAPSARLDALPAVTVPPSGRKAGRRLGRRAGSILAGASSCGFWGLGVRRSAPILAGRVVLRAEGGRGRRPGRGSEHEDTREC
jgi:hypothetical protein